MAEARIVFLLFVAILARHVLCCCCGGTVPSLPSASLTSASCSVPQKKLSFQNACLGSPVLGLKSPMHPKFPKFPQAEKNPQKLNPKPYAHPQKLTL